MPTSAPSKGLKLETPAVYRICVQGRLDHNWSDRLGGMAIRSSSSLESAPTTILEGHLADQAALSGVLNTLYDLHLPLLKVECLECQETSRGPKG